MKKTITFLAFSSLFLLQNQDMRADQPTKTRNGEEKEIVLYIYTKCPYCKKVVTFLKHNNWDTQVKTVNALDAKHHKTFKQLNPSQQCPFLSDEVHNVTMLESDDIIKYFNSIFNG